MAWTNWLGTNPPPTQDEVEDPVLAAWPSQLPPRMKRQMLLFLRVSYPEADRAWRMYLGGQISPSRMAKALSGAYRRDRRRAAAARKP